MKVEHVNPFIKATTEVIKTITGMEFSVGKPFIKVSPNSLKNVVIVVGITGEIRGQAVVNMDTDTARKVASAMMMGMPVETLDEMSKSALSELGNMIMGNAATLLSNDGVSIDITPPSLMVGENISLSSGSMRTISIPLMSEGDEITVDVSFKE